MNDRRSDIARRVFAANLKMHEPARRVASTAQTREHVAVLNKAAARLSEVRNG